MADCHEVTVASVEVAAKIESERFEPEAAELRDICRRAEDMFADHEYPDELLRFFSQIEDQAFESLGCDAVLGNLPEPVRAIVSWMFAQAAEVLRLPEGSDLQAAMLLDVCLERDSGARDLATLPATFAGICHILFKANAATVFLDKFVLLSMANWLGSWLTQSSYADVPVLEPKDLQTREIHIMTALQWRTEITTTTKWLAAHCCRFDSATQGLLKTSIDWVFARSCAQARTLAQHHSSLEMRPRGLATGFFCNALVAARILPAELFRPADAEGCESLFNEDDAGARDCVYPVDLQNQMFDVVQLATVSTKTDLGRDYVRAAILSASSSCKNSV